MIQKVLLIVGALMLTTSPEVFGAVADLPQTGQTACYGAAGSVIPCAGTGQDGELQKGVPWPSPRFQETGAGNTCILDNLTGLMWMKTPPASTYTWQDALDYANGRNTANLCGFNSGWRLPNINELHSLLNEAEWTTTIWLESQGFGTINNGKNWSSTTYMGDGVHNRALLVSFNTGYDEYQLKSNSDSYGVLPVRGPDTPSPAPVPKTGQTACWDESGSPVAPCTGGQDGHIQAGVGWPSPRFTVDGDCVIDNLTDLMWVQSPSTGYTTWQGALDSANGRTLCEFSDWRLPNLVELRSLLNYGESYTSTWLNNQGFANVQFNYWSSNTYAGNTTFARSASMLQSTLHYYGKGDAWQYAWAVRDLAAPDISLSPGFLDFADIVIGQASLAQTIAITNTGTADLEISDIEITGASAAMFDAGAGATNGCAIPNATVLPGESCTLDVSFAPTALDLHEALLYINSNDPDTPQVQVSLSGQGVTAIMTPLEGTAGTAITIAGAGFGDKKGKVFIGGVAAKVTSWADSAITATVKKVPFPVGQPHDVSITTKTKEIIPVNNTFTVRDPELDTLADSSGVSGDEITVTGNFFGIKKGKVYLEYEKNGQPKKKNCKVTYWNMDPPTGASEVRFIVPKVSKSLPAGDYPLNVSNKVGIATADTDFTIEP